MNMDRIKVVLGAAVTYLTLAAVILGIFVDELGKVGGIPQWVTTGLAAAVSALAVAIIIIRRVEPVIPSRRGLIEPKPPLDGLVPGQVPRDRGESLLVVVILVAVIFIAVVVATRVM